MKNAVYIFCITCTLCYLPCSCSHKDLDTSTDKLILLSMKDTPDRKHTSERLKIYPSDNGEVSYHSNKQEELQISEKQELLHMFQRGRNGVVEFETNIEASSYNSLLITLRYDSFDRKQFRTIYSDKRKNIRPKIVIGWTKQGYESFSDIDSTSVLVRREKGCLQTYQIVLSDKPTWCGNITGIRLSLFPVGVHISLSELLIKNRPDLFSGRSKLSHMVLDNQSRAVSIHTPPSLVHQRIKLPKAAKLGFGVALINSGRESHTSITRLTIRLKIMGAEEIQLFDKKLQKKSNVSREEWEDFCLDLRDYEQEEVILSWNVTSNNAEKNSIIAMSQPFIYSPNHNSSNVLLISLDTLRPDHLSCYGYPKSTSPNIDWLSKQGTTMSSTVTTYPSTTAAHTSLLTGLYPFDHKVIFSNNSLDYFTNTLAGSLLSRDYLTIAVTGGGQLALHRRLYKDQQ